MPEEELDNEVDQADKIREKIQLAIIDIDQALKVVTLMRDEVTETHERSTTRKGGATDSPLEEPPTPDAGDTPLTDTSITEDETACMLL